MTNKEMYGRIQKFLELYLDVPEGRAEWDGEECEGTTTVRKMFEDFTEGLPIAIGAYTDKELDEFTK